MKILHIISSSGMYGAESVLFNLLTWLKEHKDHEPYLLCLRSDGKEKPEIYHHAKALGIEAGVFFCQKRLDFEVLKRIKSFIRSERIDIVHTHGYKSNFYGLWAARATKTRIVATLHGWTRDTKQVRLYEMIDNFLIRHMDHLIAVSPLIEQTLIKKRVNRRKLTFIPNAIDMKQFDPSASSINFREQLGVEGNYILGVVGRLSSEKGQRYLIEALMEVKKTVNGIKLLFIGDGPLKENLMSHAQKCGVLEDVIFAGVQKDMVAVYKAIDIMVMPSLSEGIPIALLEAMSMGVPVIASKVGGVPYVISDGEGIMVEPANPAQLAQAIQQLINDRALQRALSTKARAKIAARFSIESFSSTYEMVYEKLITKKGK